MASADLSGVSLRLVDSVEAAGQLLTWLSERRPGNVIATDTETGEKPGNPRDDAFSPWHGRLRLAQLGDGMTGWSIPWERWNGVFHEAMERYQGEIICHNVSFEYKWFEVQSDFKLPWHRTHDTMIMSQIIHPTQSAALKSLTSRYVDSKAAALQQMLDKEMVDNKWTWGTIPVTNKKYYSYGALDCVLTVRLYEELKSRLTPEFQVLYDMEMGVRRICSRMELNGARVDVEYCKEQYEALSAYSERIREWVKAAYGINAGSPSQLTKVFVDRLGATVSPEAVTPTGVPKMDKVQLMNFKVQGGNGELGQLAEQVLAMRKAEKLARTYFLNFIEKQEDGILHPSIGTMAARTGRMSIRDPALQTLSKGEARVRNAFIARYEDEALLTSDLDQVEFRLTAALSGDPALIGMFHRVDSEGGDAFTEILRTLYNDPTASKEDKRRKLVKGFVYSSAYGAGIDKMASITGVSEGQMREVADAFDSQYPGKKQLARELENEAMQNLRATGEAFITNRFGRRLPVEEGKIYTATNYAIQSTAADVFKLNLLKLDAAGLTEQMVVPVHDEIVMSVKKSDVDELRATIRDCMTTSSPWAVPLTAGCDGPFDRWGDAID